MAARKKSKLAAQGKVRRLDGTGWPWRVRLYAPPPGGTSYQVKFKVPVGDGEPWNQALRRANSETGARKIFAQAEMALDIEQAAPASVRVRATHTIAALGAEYIEDSKQRGKAPRTIQGRESLRERPHHPGDRRRSRDEVAGGPQPQSDGTRVEDHPIRWRPRGPARSLEIGLSTVLQGTTTQYVDPRLRPETRQVKAMADAADLLCGPEGTNPPLTRLPLSGTKIRVAGFGGLRLGEQNGSERSTSSSSAAVCRSTAAGARRAIPTASATR